MANFFYFINSKTNEEIDTQMRKGKNMEIPHGFPNNAKSSDVSLQELRDKLAEFAKVRGWEKYHSPRNLLLALVGEVGELSEVFQWKGEVGRGLPNWSSAEKEHLEEELSDVLLYLIQLADVCGLDLGQAALTKIHKNAQKYPVVGLDQSASYK